MTQKNLKSSIEQVLKHFSQASTSESVKHLFETLGYSTQREVILDTHTPDDVVEVFGWENFTEDRGLLNEWESVDCLFQVTEDEITQNPQLRLFQPSFNKDYLKSYAFIGLTLQNPHYSRSQLASITREINRQSDIPIMVLFRYGEWVTLSIINRRPNKLDRDKDVLEKITLIKDIHIHCPHRAHIEILNDLALFSLKNVRNFDELYTAWQKVLDTSELNKKFFQEMSNWYFWAIETVTLPDGAEKDENIRNATSVIRLITRLIFVWFLKEKGLVPSALFDENQLKEVLKSLESAESTYYKAILQNLFFATLNTEMNTDKKPDNRKFRGKTTQKGGRDQHYGIANVYRYQDYFTDSDDFLGLCSNIPFLNGGLFECLDKASEGIRIDGFSERKENPLKIPNMLFFGEVKEIDLNKVYGTKNKKYKVQGLIEIFNRYKFTIDENTPIEEEIALDPELLGKVFENLLAEYNPETETTARKQTGSFYTPREIVNYMVDESLIAYLQNIVSSSNGENTESKLRHLLSYNDELHQFNDNKVECLINAIDNVKIIDIACGSGAFPMGILQKLVFILGKLDPNNSKWKQQQKEKAIQPVLKDIQVAKQISYEEAREEAIQKLQERLAEIEGEFENNEMDYPRKLFLIENCIFGVDIQAIAVQIAKLRFFISLIVDQKVNDSQPNRGILPLPNLETKFVAANSLIGIETQLTLRSPEVIDKEEELKKVRQQHFKARTPATKRKCREKDEALRQEISELLKSTGLESATADTLARWNPYDLNASSDFFDAEWMFGVSAFDICIGNPPWGIKLSQDLQKKLINIFPVVPTKVKDSYLYFINYCINLLKNRGMLSLLVPNTWLLINNAKDFRSFLLKFDIKEIIDYGDGIFEKATVESVYLFLKKSKESKICKVKRYQKMSEITSSEIDKEIWLNDQYIRINIDLNPSKYNILKKIESVGEIFEKNCHIIWGIKPYQVGCGKPPQTKEMIKQRIYHSDIKFDETWKPLLVGSHVDRYSIIYPGRQFIRYGEWLMYRSNEELMLKQKIILRQTSDILRAAYDDSSFYCQNSLFIISSEKINLKFLLSLLNSKVLNFVYQLKNPQVNKVFAEIKPSIIQEIPIYNINTQKSPDRNNYNIIISITNKILEIKRQNPKADTSDLETEIDQIVYQLYCLSEEEIAIIEESVKRK